MGFTPDLTVGVYVGYDNPRSLGSKRTGGEVAAPIVADFMKMALQGKAAVPFRVPRGIELIPIHVNTGTRGVFGEDGVILEAFKPGDEPPANSVVIGQALAQNGADQGVVLFLQLALTKPPQPNPLQIKVACKAALFLLRGPPAAQQPQIQQPSGGLTGKVLASIECHHLI